MYSMGFAVPFRRHPKFPPGRHRLPVQSRLCPGVKIHPPRRPAWRYARSGWFPSNSATTHRRGVTGEIFSNLATGIANTGTR